MMYLQQCDAGVVGYGAVDLSGKEGGIPVVGESNCTRFTFNPNES